MWNAPFAHRVVTLVLFLALVSGVELVLRGDRAVRWRGSLLILTLAAAGALLGPLVDRATVSISPAYFAIGKGLGWQAGLRWRALALGAQAGASVGVVVGCAFVYAGYGGTWPTLPVSRMLRYVPACVLGAGLCGLLLGTCAALAPPPALLDIVRPALDPGQEAAFVAVWLAHVGVYLGATLGTIRAAVRIRSARRKPGRGASTPERHDEQGPTGGTAGGGLEKCHDRRPARTIGTRSAAVPTREIELS